MPTSISQYRPSISKLHIVPDIEAKTLTFNIEGLVFNIIHILILGILALISKLGKVPDEEMIGGNLKPCRPGVRVTIRTPRDLDQASGGVCCQ
jgi:hypothetical protein